MIGNHQLVRHEISKKFNSNNWNSSQRNHINMQEVARTRLVKNRSHNSPKCSSRCQIPMTRSTSSHIPKRLSYDTQPKIGQISSHGRAMSPKPTIPNDILTTTDPLSTPKNPLTAQWVTNKESFTHIHLTHQLQTQMLTINSNLTTPHREPPGEESFQETRESHNRFCQWVSITPCLTQNSNTEFTHTCAQHIYIYMLAEQISRENSRVPSSNLVSESAAIWKLSSSLSLSFYLPCCYALSKKASINPPLQSPHIGHEGPP